MRLAFGSVFPRRRLFDLRGVNANPWRGQRTLGPTEALVTMLVEHVLDFARSPPGDDESRRFPAGIQVIRGTRVTRADGVVVPFLVVVSASDDPDLPRLPTGGVGTLTTTGETVIGLHLSTRAQFHVSTWQDALASFFAHELTHLMDPSRKHPGQRAAVRASTMAQRWEPGSEAEWHAYYNDPVEITARRHEAWREIRKGGGETIARHFAAQGRPRGEIAATVLKISGTWRDIQAHLSPANRRVFLDMAAHFVQEVLGGVSPGRG